MIFARTAFFVRHLPVFLLHGFLSLFLPVGHVAWGAAQEEAKQPASSFALQDGDVVGFLGDSITAERTYGKLVEQYTLLRHPERNVRFLNLGIGGDTAAGGLKRLQSDVFERGVTVLTVAYGINDIGWGTKADDEHRNLYLSSIREIVRQCQKNGVRVYICSAAVTADNPETSEDSYLQKMCDDGLAIAKSEGGQTIRLQRYMREVQKRVANFNQGVAERDRRSLHVPDGIHLNDLGQLAMAFAILDGLGADSLVSSAALDASKSEAIDQQRCALRDVKLKENGGSFVRLDECLPYNNGPFAGLNYGFVPVSNYNRYGLKVTGLQEGKYLLEVDGSGVGIYSAEQLADGVDIASATTNGFLPGGPWDAQANVLKQLTEARSQLGQADGQRKEYFEDSDWTRSLTKKSDAIDDGFYELQRQVARPRPYRFVLTKQVDE